MDLNTARKIPEELAETGDLAHSRVGQLIQTCAIVIEDIEEGAAYKNWTDSDCSNFLDSSVDLLMGATVFATEGKASVLKSYFPSDTTGQEIESEEGSVETEGDTDVMPGYHTEFPF